MNDLNSDPQQDLRENFNDPVKKSAYMNERKTERLVYKILEKNKETYDVEIEEQKSNDPSINKLLQHASKKVGGTGRGNPEFIIKLLPDLLMVVECKADPRKHRSKDLDKYADYAVDGSLLYSSYLSRDYNVIAVAVSGEYESEMKVSTFLQLKNSKYEDVELNKILPFETYIEMYEHDPNKEKIAKDDLIRYSKDLNNKLRDDFELEEGQRPLLVSGILIALENKSFRKSYTTESAAKYLALSLSNTIKKVLEQHNVERNKRDDMTNVYNFIETNNNISKDFGKMRNTKLRDLISEVDVKVRSFVKEYKFHDILGQFYGEFLRYANIDQGLGIVLTPNHITNLFSELAGVNKNSIIFDNCCGTAGFLISSMRRMIQDANNDQNKICDIYNKQLIGIENNPKMFCLACSNMLLRGDGKSNIYHYDCFKIDLNKIQNMKPNIGFLNPPYSKKKKGSKELNYVLNCLECLQINGICVAILPMSCATSYSPLKDKLLEKHTLMAVMSLPLELFYPIGVTPCIMMFKAHIPHDVNTESWFGYWRDDGFLKVKNDGRVDKNTKYDNIKKIWLDDFRNRRNVEGRCITHKVGCNDEWCAEAYMKTDYSTLTHDDFKKHIKDFVIYKVRSDDS